MGNNLCSGSRKCEPLAEINLVCCVGVLLIDPCLLSLKRKIRIKKKQKKKKRKNKSREIRQN